MAVRERGVSKEDNADSRENERKTVNRRDFIKAASGGAYCWAPRRLSSRGCRPANSGSLGVTAELTHRTGVGCQACVTRCQDNINFGAGGRGANWSNNDKLSPRHTNNIQVWRSALRA